MGAPRMLCPRRSEVGGADVFKLPKEDWWHDAGSMRSCSYCGSLHPVEFIQALEGGHEIIPTDKDYKAYVMLPGRGQTKFYFQHLNEGQCCLLVDMLNAGTLKFAAPGRFYVRPFFIGSA